MSVPIGRILEILPHRYPFLLVDRIVEVEPGKRAVGLKNVTINEPFFPGHFPGYPVMPGVLIVEAMAQTGAMLLFHDHEDELKDKYIYLAGVDGARFRRPVVPGDQLLMELEVLALRRSTCRMKAIARVDGAKVAEATLLSMVVDREDTTP